MTDQYLAFDRDETGKPVNVRHVHAVPVIEDGKVIGYVEGQNCVPDDDQPHAIINGHHVSWCPCGSDDREHEPGPWDAWGSEDPWK